MYFLIKCEQYYVLPKKKIKIDEGCKICIAKFSKGSFEAKIIDSNGKLGLTFLPSIIICICMYMFLYFFRRSRNIGEAMSET